MDSIQPITRLIVHHSASARTTSITDLRRWHIEENGWDDIGYHYFVPASGDLTLCRSLAYSGAHAKGSNYDSVGICLAGDNTDNKDGWIPGQVRTLHLFIQALTVLYPDLKVLGHRDVADTECPGLDVNKLLYGPNSE